MDLPEFIERNFREFMRPIQDAGYTSLLYEKSTGSLETQLKSYLLFAFRDGGSLETSNFRLTIDTVVNREPIQFAFKGKFDPKYENPAQFSGLQVSKADHTAFYPYSPSGQLPSPEEVYQASIQPLQKKSTRYPRLIKSWLGKGKKL
jgi:hypothetical protein